MVHGRHRHCSYTVNKCEMFFGDDSTGRFVFKGKEWTKSVISRGALSHTNFQRSADYPLAYPMHSHE